MDTFSVGARRGTHGRLFVPMKNENDMMYCCMIRVHDPIDLQIVQFSE